MCVFRRASPRQNARLLFLVASLGRIAFFPCFLWARPSATLSNIDISSDHQGRVASWFVQQARALFALAQNSYTLFPALSTFRISKRLQGPSYSPVSHHHALDAESIQAHGGSRPGFTRIPRRGEKNPCPVLPILKMMIHSIVSFVITRWNSLGLFLHTFHFLPQRVFGCPNFLFSRRIGRRRELSTPNRLCRSTPGEGG